MPARLVARGGEPGSVFGLLGRDENAATFALGWAASRSDAFVGEILAELGVAGPTSGMVVELQRHDGDGGFTDVEWRVPGGMHIIFEAKHGWALPGEAQLARYAARVGGAPGARLVVSVTAASAQFAARHLPTDVLGVPTAHLSWGKVRAAAARARAGATGAEEKLWLRELQAHLEVYVAAQNTTSNMAYVVSLSAAPIVEGASHSWIGVVEKDGCYFHPYGGKGGWPVVPPNYMAFRYDGRLQSVRHVESAEVVRNRYDVNPLWGDSDVEHVVYRLGPPMRPAREMRTGPSVVRAARVWCAIDTLLSGACATISEAVAETTRRAAAEL